MKMAMYLRFAVYPDVLSSKLLPFPVANISLFPPLLISLGDT